MNQALKFITTCNTVLSSLNRVENNLATTKQHGDALLHKPLSGKPACSGRLSYTVFTRK